jgi:predicted nucleic acid-binding protein
MSSFLLDKSAFARMRNPRIAAALGPRLVSGACAVTGIGMLEILFSSTAAAAHRKQLDMLEGLPRVAVTEKIVDRALEVQVLMHDRGTHRAPSPADLILAACAEANSLTVLHYDKDFDLIADVTGQPMEWIAPAGSIP